MTSKQKTNKILSADDASIELAVSAIKAGKLIGLPTETVYGLAANALDDTTVFNVFKAKERPSFNPLIVHVADVNMARELAEVSLLAEKLMLAFWPGPLTLVLKLKPNNPLSSLVTAGLDSVALRSPNHPIALKLLERGKLPLAAPSANKSGTISPTTAAHVVDGLGEKIAYVLDGGACTVGLESTIISLTNDQVSILRPGAITAEMVKSVTGQTVTENTKPQSIEAITAPGQLESHYAPNNNLRLNASSANEGEFLLGFGNIKGHTSLSPNGNVDEAAKNLFAMLRVADSKTKDGIAIAPIPNEGMGIAINDRIKRAAAPKS